MMYCDIQNGITFDDHSVYTFNDFLDRDDYHEWEIMQFTGLHDKNGKEIYEGDLLKLKSINYPHYEPYIWEVYYSPESMMFRFRNNVPYPRNCDSDIWGLHDFEVIGNIYQNPELIKQ